MEEIEKVNESPEFREYMSVEEDNRKIENSIRTEEKEEGKIEEKKEIAKGMLKDNIDINMISKYTNLSIDEINELGNN